MKIRLCAFADEADKNIDGQIEALKRNGIGLTELRTVDGENIKDLSLDKAAAVKRKLDENGIGVWALGSPLGKTKITDDFEIEAERLNHLLKLCKIFGCDKIRVFSFFVTGHIQQRAEVIRRMRLMVQAAAQENVSLYHENEKEIYGDTALRVTDLLDNVPGLQSVYDPANYIQCGENIEDAMNNVFKRAGYIHIKDCVDATGELVPSGLGDGRITEIIRKLKQDVTLTLEPHLSVFEGYAAVDNTAMKNKFEYPSCGAAFDAGAEALKKLLKGEGFKEQKDGIWIKP